MDKIFSDEFFMKEALKQARLAIEKDEVPVGAVIVCNNQVIAKAHNSMEMLNDSTAHAELIAITSACHALGSKYLNECTIYVTVEPCVMCSGAIFWSQLSRLVYGAPDEKAGFTKYNPTMLAQRINIKRGVLEDECAHIISSFFKSKRIKH
ncbi:nucleoside deaminase [Bacteroidota bacterium]